jgi:hypothetical protein
MLPRRSYIMLPIIILLQLTRLEAADNNSVAKVVDEAAIMQIADAFLDCMRQLQDPHCLSRQMARLTEAHGLIMTLPVGWSKRTSNPPSPRGMQVPEHSPILTIGKWLESIFSIFLDQKHDILFHPVATLIKGTIIFKMLSLSTQGEQSRRTLGIVHALSNRALTASGDLKQRILAYAVDLNSSPSSSKDNTAIKELPTSDSLERAMLHDILQALRLTNVQELRSWAADDQVINRLIQDYMKPMLPFSQLAQLALSPTAGNFVTANPAFLSLSSLAHVLHDAPLLYAEVVERFGRGLTAHHLLDGSFELLPHAAMKQVIVDKLREKGDRQMELQADVVAMVEHMPNLRDSLRAIRQHLQQASKVQVGVVGLESILYHQNVPCFYDSTTKQLVCNETWHEWSFCNSVQRVLSVQTHPTRPDAHRLHLWTGRFANKFDIVLVDRLDRAVHYHGVSHWTKRSSSRSLLYTRGYQDKQDGEEEEFSMLKFDVHLGHTTVLLRNSHSPAPLKKPARKRQANESHTSSSSGDDTAYDDSLTVQCEGAWPPETALLRWDRRTLYVYCLSQGCDLLEI